MIAAAPPDVPPVAVTDGLRELWRRRGVDTVEACGVVWAREPWPFHTLLAPEAVVPDERTLDEVVRARGVVAVRAPVADDHGRFGAYVLDRLRYSLAEVRRSARRNIRHGLEACRCERLDVADLRRLGQAAVFDTLERQRRASRELTEGWTRFTAALAGLAEVHVYGAFVDGELASWTVAHEEGGWLRLLWRFGRTDLRASHADPALDYTLLTAPELRARFVVDGHAATLGDEGNHQYKTSIGFQIRPHRKTVRFREPVGRLLRSSAAHASLGWLREAAPESRRLAMAERILFEQGVPGRLEG